LVRGSVSTVERHVLTALELLFFNARGSTLGRNVLLVDEISKADNERNVYAMLLSGSMPVVCELLTAKAFIAVVMRVRWLECGCAVGARGCVWTLCCAIRSGLL
jgi:hypothetical protein